MILQYLRYNKSKLSFLQGSRIVRGIGANAWFQIVSSLSQLVLVPLFLFHWGVTRYGEWLVVFSFVSVLGAADLGLASSGGNLVAMLAGKKELERSNSVFQTMLVAMSIGALGLILVAVTIFFVSGRELMQAGALLVCAVACDLVSNVANSSFRCSGNFAFGRLVSSAKPFLAFMFQAYSLYSGAEVLGVASSVLASSVLVLVLNAVFVRRFTPWLNLGIRHASAVELRQLFFPAISFSAVPVSLVLQGQGMVQLVGFFLGPTAVVVWTSHRMLCNTVVQFVNMIAYTMWTEISLSYGQGDMRRVAELDRTGSKWTLATSLILAAALWMLAPYIFFLWTAGELKAEYPLISILLIGVVLRSLWWSGSVVLLATNHTWQLALLLFSASAVALVASSLFAKYGIVPMSVCLMIFELVMIGVTMQLTLKLIGVCSLGFLISRRR